MNITKLIRKKSKWIIGLTSAFFIITTLIGLIASYASLFIRQ